MFPRPDDPYPPGAPVPGIGEGPCDQLRGLYGDACEPDRDHCESPLTNLYGDLLAAHPAAAYSYGFVRHEVRGIEWR